MNRSIYKLLASALILAVMAFAIPATAQEPPHPPSTGHGANNNQIPGGPSAPLDGGISILVALGLAYSARKVKKCN
jgi:hypothetical protein